VNRLLHPCLAWLLALGAFCAGSTHLLAKDEPGLPELRRALLEAHGDQAVGQALDRLQERIGKVKELADVGAFGDWLGGLPDGRDAHPVVLARRGWAYTAARRGAEALPLLEAALKDDPSRGYVRATLGEALRQAGRPAEALDMLATARRAGYDAPHLRESALEAMWGLRRSGAVKSATALPDYAKAVGPYLLAGEDPVLRARLARALLDDLAAYGAPDTAERSLAWAECAGEHAHHVLSRQAEVEGGARLAFDAAVALTRLDEAKEGRTPRFDLLAAAYARGKPTDREGHDLPQVLPLLAEAALREGRFELAERLARERLDLSESPAARRVLLALPPDLGD
jgi:hypothetical protein